MCALLAKPFVILTGLAGSGKTKLAQVFAQWICGDSSQWCVVPVGADWTNREALLGYPDALQEGEYVLPENGALELLIQAGKEENWNKPYFLILDEMNLSHVERYFADFLSVMESGEALPLHPDSGVWAGCKVPAQIALPPNLFIVGTVNVDETTYMFSPKVLDRANVIESRVTAVEMARFLAHKAPVDLEAVGGKGASTGASFVGMASFRKEQLEEDEKLRNTLLNFFSKLKSVGVEFGYRTASEIYAFVVIARRLLPDWPEEEMIIRTRHISIGYWSISSITPVPVLAGGLSAWTGHWWRPGICYYTPPVSYRRGVCIRSFPVDRNCSAAGIY